MNNTFPQLIVFNEKHGDRYFMANSQEEKAVIFSGIIRERFNKGWYFKPEKPELSADYKNLTDEQINNLPEELRVIALKKKKSYENRMKYYSIELEEYENIKRIAEVDSAREASKLTCTNSVGKSFNLALQIIFDRSDGEYERYSIEEFSDFTYFD